MSEAQTAEPESDQIEVQPALEEMFKAGVHFGYSKTRRHPDMRRFIVGVKSNVEIFNLEIVLEYFNNALAFIESLGAENAAILWVGSKAPAADAIRKTAEALGHSYVDRRWLGGTITNFNVVHSRVKYFLDLKEKERSGELMKYKKQERTKLQKDMEKLEREFAGILNMHELPKALFVVDSGGEKIAVDEARKKKIPVIAILNTDCDPGAVRYPIPANDNSKSSIEHFLDKAREVYQRGLVAAKEKGTDIQSNGS